MAVGEKNVYFFYYPRGYLPLNEFHKYIDSSTNLQKMFDT